MISFILMLHAVVLPLYPLTDFQGCQTTLHSHTLGALQAHAHSISNIKITHGPEQSMSKLILLRCQIFFALVDFRTIGALPDMTKVSFSTLS